MGTLYRIKFKLTRDNYIGATTADPKVRFAAHKRRWSRGTAAPALQRAFKRNGIEHIEFIVLATCPDNILHACEREAIKLKHPSVNMNMATTTPEQVAQARKAYRLAAGVQGADLDRPPHDPEIRRRRTYLWRGEELTTREIEQRGGRAALRAFYREHYKQP